MANPDDTARKMHQRRASPAPPSSSSDDESDFEERRQRLDVFNQPWMNSCLNETVLPGSPWHKILNRITPYFIRRVKGQFGDGARKEAIFQLLGPNYVSKCFPNEKRDVMALMRLNEADRRQIVREAADWLNNQWTKAADEAKCQRVPINEDVDPKQSPEMAAFMTHVYRIFYVGLDRNMYISQAKAKRQKGEKAAAQRNEKVAPGEKQTPTGSQLGFYDAHDLASTARSAVSSEAAANDPKKERAMMNNENVQLSISDNLAVNAETAAAMNVAVHRYKKNVALPVHATMPPLTSEHSDRMGRSVVAILQRDPRRYTDVVCKLHGRQLPPSLRIYLWLETLLRKERDRIKEIQAEKIVRENFGRAMARGLAELNVRKVTSSPIHSIIENALTETYKRSPGLHASFNDAHLKEAAEALNALYISDRSYEVHMIFWLYPLQLAFEDASHQPEHPLDLALYLHLFRRDVFPGWDECRKTAEQIVRTLVKYDFDLAEHLADICRRHNMAKKLPADIVGNKLSPGDGDPDAFVDKKATFVRDDGLKGFDAFVGMIYSWVSEGFVGVLDGHGVLFAWDQMMMFGWHTRVVEHLALAIIMLLRHRFLEAFDFESLEEILIQEPNILYTVDLQAAFVYIEHNDNILEASRLNRQKMQLDELFLGRSSVGGSLSARDRGQLTSLEAVLPRFGLRDLEIQLIIPNQCLQKHQWLYDLDVSKFSVVLSTYFGSIHMGNFTNARPPFARDSATNSAGDIVHVVRFIDEFVGGPFTPKNFIDRTRDVEILRRSVGMPNVFMALIYNGDFPMKSDETHSALFGWTQIGAWVPSEDPNNKAWIVPNDVKWYSLQTAKLALALAPLAALADKNILIDTDYSSHFSHLTVEIFNPTTVPVDAQLFDRIFQQNADDVPAAFADDLPELDFTSVRQVVADLPPSGGWVKHAVSLGDLQPEQQNLNGLEYTEPFDFYVDAARFLPDNATITLAHLTFANAGSVAAPENVLFLSHLESSAKSPFYNGRVEVNAKKKKPTKEMIAILSLLTVDKLSGKPYLIGTAVFACFKEVKIGKTKKTVLRTGGHQLRLVQSLPPVPDRRLNTVASDVLIALMAKPVVPGTSILIRLMTHQDSFATAPLYSSGYYQNEETFLASPFEEALMTVSVEEDRAYIEAEGGPESAKHPPTVRDTCHFLMTQRNEQPPADSSPAGYGKWMQQRCIRQGNFPDQLLPAADFLTYSQVAGIGIKFGHLANINDENQPEPSRLYFCHCQLFPPIDARVAVDTKKELFGLEIDLDSSARQPSWKDPVQTLYPMFNKSVVLLFVVYRLKVDYIVPSGTSERDLLRPGTLRSTNSKQSHLPPTANDLDTIGWAVVPLFKNNSVFEQPNCQLNLVEGKLPTDPNLILGSFVRNTNNSDSTDKSPKLHVSIVDGRRAVELSQSSRAAPSSDSLRASLFKYIMTSVTSTSGKEPPPPERVTWHVECCLRRVTSVVLSTLTATSYLPPSKRQNRQNDRNNANY